MPITAQTSKVNNYTVGRGRAYFGRFNDGTLVSEGDRFLGDASGLSVTVKSTELDHYQSTGGVKLNDKSATIQSDASGQLMTENVDSDNLAMFFFGDKSTVTVASGNVAAEVVGPVIPGLSYQLGAASDPVGARGLDGNSSAVVTNSAGNVTYTVDTDYAVDYGRGRIYVAVGGNITSGQSLKVSYHKLSTSRSRVISGKTPIEGSLRFDADNTEGAQNDFFLPYVKLSPNGSYELIGDKWATLTFDLKVLTIPGLASLYIDGQAV